MSENYLQHADHFSRILISQELNKTSNENNVIEQNFKKNTDGISVESSENKKEKENAVSD